MKKILIASFCSVLAFIIYFSSLNIPELPAHLRDLISYSNVKSRLKASDGTWINTPIVNQYAVGNPVTLTSLPPFFIQSLLLSEDRRFFQHHGIDVKSLTSASVTNLLHGRIIRGASTITEQVAKMILGGEKTLSRRIRAAKLARALEKKYSKDEILSFYLSQITFPGNVRGIEDGSQSLFARQFSTLTKKEILALICTIRSPGALNPHKKNGREKIILRVNNLISRLVSEKYITEAQAEEIIDEPLEYEKNEDSLSASHFARAVLNHLSQGQTIRESVSTTLNPDVQKFSTAILERTINIFKKKRVHNGALIVVDKKSSSILAWVNAGDSSEIDGVLTLRQPGSTLKPLLYSLAIEKGWTPDTVLHDVPTSRPVGSGEKNFKNYSQKYYGDITLREALGNSLNIPAIEAITFVGVDNFLSFLKELRITSLNKASNFYGEGLALGNGEISLFELVQAYTSLSKNGELFPLSFLSEPMENSKSTRRVFKHETARYISDILSDSKARLKEFGDDQTFPYKIAYKTGTSTDYKDAWALGFSDAFIIGVWVGNFDRSSMDEITGSKVPLLVLKSVFTELGKKFGPTPLLIDQRNKELTQDNPSPISLVKAPRIETPTPGLTLAFDPRIPKSLQKFTFKTADTPSNSAVDWFLNDNFLGAGTTYSWSVQRGEFVVYAKIQGERTPSIKFYVK